MTRLQCQKNPENDEIGNKTQTTNNIFSIIR